MNKISAFIRGIFYCRTLDRILYMTLIALVIFLFVFL